MNGTKKNPITFLKSHIWICKLILVSGVCCLVLDVPLLLRGQWFVFSYSLVTASHSQLKTVYANPLRNTNHDSWSVQRRFIKQKIHCKQMLKSFVKELTTKALMKVSLLKSYILYMLYLSKVQKRRHLSSSIFLCLPVRKTLVVCVCVCVCMGVYTSVCLLRVHPLCVCDAEQTEKAELCRAFLL